eukprot:1159825-Pelagomonas_calceolata.AAC.1
MSSMDLNWLLLVVPGYQCLCGNQKHLCMSSRIPVSLWQPETLVFVFKGIELPPVDGLVMNSMCDAMFEPEGWQRFSDFVHK